MWRVIALVVLISIALTGLAMGAVWVGEAIDDGMILYHRAPRQIVLHDIDRDLQYRLLHDVNEYRVAPNRQFVLHTEQHFGDSNNPDDDWQRCAWTHIRTGEERAAHRGERCSVYTAPRGGQSLFITHEAVTWTFHLHDAAGLLLREWQITEPSQSQVTTWSPNGSFIVTAIEYTARPGVWKLYHTNLMTGESKLLLQDVQIVEADLAFESAGWSPDGNYLLIHAMPGDARTGWRRLVIDADGNVRNIVEGDTQSQLPLWLSNSPRVIHQENLDGETRLVVTDVVNGNHQPMTEFADGWLVYQITPDERVWLLRRWQDDVFALLLLDTQTLEQTLITESPGPIFGGLLRDGRYLGYRTDTELGLYDLTTGTRQLFDMQERGTSFTSSPRAAVPYAMQVERTRGVGWTLRVLNTETREIVEFDGQTDLSIWQWLPDGRHVLLQSYSNPETNYLLSIDSMTLREIGRTYGFAWPDWTPDLSQVVFGTGLDFNERDLFMLDIASGTVRQVTDTNAGESVPLWIP